MIGWFWIFFLHISLQVWLNQYNPATLIYYRASCCLKSVTTSYCIITLSPGCTFIIASRISIFFVKIWILLPLYIWTQAQFCFLVANIYKFKPWSYWLMLVYKRKYLSGFIFLEFYIGNIASLFMVKLHAITGPSITRPYYHANSNTSPWSYYRNKPIFFCFLLLKYNLIQIGQLHTCIL